MCSQVQRKESTVPLHTRARALRRGCRWRSVVRATPTLPPGSTLTGGWAGKGQPGGVCGWGPRKGS